MILHFDYRLDLCIIARLKRKYIMKIVSGFTDIVFECLIPLETAVGSEVAVKTPIQYLHNA